MAIFDFEGRAVGYDDTGDGPAVVLLHGLLMNRTMWEPQMDSLRDAYRVVTIDAPGHGDSDPVAVGWTFDDWTREIWAVADGLGIGEAAFGGQSMGGWTSMLCALARPERTRGIMFMDSQAGPEDPEKVQQYEAMLQVALADGISDDLASVLLMILFSQGFAASAAAEPWRKAFTTEDPHRYHAVARAVLDRPDRTHLLAGVRCPALVVHGEEDVAISMDLAEVVAGALGTVVHRIPDAGHASPAEKPELVTPLIRGFLDSL